MVVDRLARQVGLACGGEEEAAFLRLGNLDVFAEWS